MDVLYPRCAGLDVHKATIVACVRIMAGAKTTRACRTFETSTTGLQALLAWLTEQGCTHVAMEATGVYWKPVWNILSDGGFELIVANAAHIKAVPGRKSDVNDTTWIADLLACGLIRASFVPAQEFQELRALLRTRTQLTREQTRHSQRLQKTLEEANIKLDSAISDVMGVSGRRMVEAIIAGETNPVVLAALADRRIKTPRAELVEALRGRVTEHHRFMLRLYLDQHDRVAEAIATIDAEIDTVVAHMDHKEVAGQAAFRALILLLTTVPGVGQLAATIILAEIGTDMSRFPTAGHLLSWAGFCPGQNESAGKRRSAKLRKGAPWLKVILVQCARAASRTKGKYYKAQFWRLCARHGKKKAACAVAASMLTAIYHMLKDGTEHQDLGAEYFDRRPPEAKAKKLVGQLAKLGFAVELRPIAEAA
ncbi:IS110 family RNA-guided transposase [Rhodopila globiformis]|uniref:IS110 family transposase n=1 Tax=Rhodopila globiformis TaxID=1071 RepID=A0A2S6MYL5_RHOGL|nr:IS110 family transposase [Rhodopila globiformis]PPQ27464.1 IS110 family transposase [Rhodopila globiformis]